MTGNKYDRDQDVLFVDKLLKLEPIQFGHPVIQHQTSRLFAVVGVQKTLGASERFDQKPALGQSTRKHQTNFIFVVD